MAANQKSVALACGVSRSTVGMILGGGVLAERYSEATRQKVRAMAARLNYAPNRAAQTMRKKRSNLIAIIHFESGIEVVQKINQRLSQKVKAAGYDCLAVDLGWHGGCVERALTELTQLRVEGALISHIQEIFEDSHVVRLREAGIPTVSIGGQYRPSMPLVCDDVAKGFQGLTHHLLQNGHRLILQLTPDKRQTKARSVVKRIEGFQHGIKAAGTWHSLLEEDFFRLWPTLPAKDILGLSISQDRSRYDQVDRPVYHFCQRLFQTGRLPDALMCANDALALEAILSAQENNLHVPRDFAVTGYDNDHLGAFPAIGLTTAEQDVENICTQGLEVLLRRMRNINTKVENRMLPARLIFRTSSGSSRHSSSDRPDHKTPSAVIA